MSMYYLFKRMIKKGLVLASLYYLSRSCGVPAEGAAPYENQQVTDSYVVPVSHGSYYSLFQKPTDGISDEGKSFDQYEPMRRTGMPGLLIDSSAYYERDRRW